MNQSRRHRLTLTAGMLMLAASACGQGLLGNSGGHCIPSAEMLEAGTFRCGIHYVQGGTIVGPTKSDSYDFPYDTGIYYLNFTAFSWLEATFSETIVANKLKDGSYYYYNQDRTLSLKLRPVSEGKYRPAIAVGAIDPFSICDHPTYCTYWAAMTKHVHSRRLHGTLGATLSYGYGAETSRMWDGVMSGLTYEPDRWQGTWLSVEYDTHGVVVGAETLLWRHLGLYVWTRDMQRVVAGARFQITLK